MLQTIMSISAYGFIIPICSVLFMYTGYKIDAVLGTSPSFMIGLLFLAVILVIGKLYKEVINMQHKV
jgi:F0F1-type ATP synthase assembly protein I